MAAGGAATAAGGASGEKASDADRRLRDEKKKVEKKLRQIKALLDGESAKVFKGHTPDEVEKISKRGELEARVRELDAELAKLAL